MSDKLTEKDIIEAAATLARADKYEPYIYVPGSFEEAQDKLFADLARDIDKHVRDYLKKWDQENRNGAKANGCDFPETEGSQGRSEIREDYPSEAQEED